MLIVKLPPPRRAKKWRKNFSPTRNTIRQIPQFVEREAKRKEILEARKVRDVERAKRKAEQEAAEAVRRAAEEAARQEQLRLEALAREAEAQREREEAERLEYERKLERDARYAARKERKKKKKSAAERYG